MQIIIILAAVFAVMLIGPIVGAAIYYKTHKGAVLHIDQNRVRDARYFGKSFSDKVREQIPGISGNKIRLSREETFLDGDDATEYPECVEELVLCRQKEFKAPKQTREFRKEIYCAKNAVFAAEDVKLRAVYCGKKMILGKGTRVVRWADAEETLAVYDNCDLGMSASAGEQMSIGKGCTFRRLYAPQIRLGQYPGSTKNASDGKDARIYRMPVEMNKEKNVRYISKERINEEGVVDFSVLSWSSVTVTEKVIVQGDIRSHKGVRLCDDAVVCGNIFAERDVVLGKNAVVLGNIFSQESIYMEEGAVVGQMGRICSVIARNNITFEKDNFVFGYVGCEKTGKTEAEKEKEKEARPYEFEDAPKRVVNLTFKDLHDYENVDKQGFRKEKSLKRVTLPEGAKKVPESMFFDCQVLEDAALAETIDEIGAYAFADCFSLSGLTELKTVGLERIGISAFENCRSLKEVSFPESLQILEGAAFAGCQAIRRITFPETSDLRYVGDHCFRECEALEELWLPDKVEYIGVSTFRGCSNLKKISVPESCSTQPGIVEVSEEHPETEVVVRKRQEIPEETDES